MAEYHLAQSLDDLRDEIDAAHPGRDKSSDGWIGDPSHQARPSDHNPDYSDGGVVRAIDVDTTDIDVNKLMGILKKDSRVNYFIHNRFIYGAEKFAKRDYDGDNPHTKHIHISIKHTAAAEKGGSWGYSASKPAPSKKPTASKPSKSVATMAKEVIAGKHGNGHANRQKSLGVNDSTYAKVKAEVNRLAQGTPTRPSKSIGQMANEVIQGKHGNGHANRQKSLGISAATYAKVRAEVNRRH